MSKIVLFFMFFNFPIWAQELSSGENSNDSITVEQKKKKPKKNFFELTPEEQMLLDPSENPYMNGTKPEDIEKMINKLKKSKEPTPSGAPIISLPTGRSKDEDDKLSESLYLQRRQEFRINSDYRAGRFLIYDCEIQNFICVTEDSMKNCEEKRKKAFDKGAYFYPCAPLKEFISKQICLYKNYEVLKREAEKKFCYKVSE